MMGDEDVEEKNRREGQRERKAQARCIGLSPCQQCRSRRDDCRAGPADGRFGVNDRTDDDPAAVSFSPPLLFSSTFSLISIVPFSTGDSFSSVRLSLYRTSEYRSARHFASSCETPGSICGVCEKTATANVRIAMKIRMCIKRIATEYTENTEEPKKISQCSLWLTSSPNNLGGKPRRKVAARININSDQKLE